MGTRTLSILVSAMLVLSLVSNAAADNRTAKMAAGTIAVVNNPSADDRLNLSTGPNQENPTLGKYYNGTYLEVLNDEEDGWVKVRVLNWKDT